MLEKAYSGSQKPIVKFLGISKAGCYTIGSMKLAVVGLFALQKLVDYSIGAFFFSLETQLLNICQCNTE